MIGLYGTFILLLGLWLTFFHILAAVAVRRDGYAVCGAKTTGTILALGAIVGEPCKPEDDIC